MMHSHKLRIDGIFHLPNRIFLTSSIISCGEVGALTHTHAHTHKSTNAQLSMERGQMAAEWLWSRE